MTSAAISPPVFPQPPTVQVPVRSPGPDHSRDDVSLIDITMGDRLQAFLNHLFSWEGLASIATICGIVAAELSGAHLSAQWIATAITVLTLVNVTGSKIAATMGRGQLQTVLAVRGKLPGGSP